MTPVAISAAARIDLDDIWFHIATDSPTNADRFLDRLVEVATCTLAVAPLSGREREELGEGLRSLPVENYLIFYRVQDGAVEVLRVIHGARDLGAMSGD